MMCPLESQFHLEEIVGLSRRYSTENRQPKSPGNYNAYAERMSWPAQRRAYVETAENSKFRIALFFSGCLAGEPLLKLRSILCKPGEPKSTKLLGCGVKRERKSQTRLSGLRHSIERR